MGCNDVVVAAVVVVVVVFGEPQDTKTRDIIIIIIATAPINPFFTYLSSIHILRYFYYLKNNFASKNCANFYICGLVITGSAVMAGNYLNNKFDADYILFDLINQYPMPIS
jgi:hypothetical protein